MDKKEEEKDSTLQTSQSIETLTRSEDDKLHFTHKLANSTSADLTSTYINLISYGVRKQRLHKRVNAFAVSNKQIKTHKKTIHIPQNDLIHIILIRTH